MGWNLGDVWEANAGVIGDEPAIIHDGRVVSWAELDRRSNALARHLLDAGTKPDDKIAIYSHNRAEWMESVCAAFKARLVPVNVNYRYRDEELLYLLDNSDAVAIIFETTFVENLERLKPELGKIRTWLQLDDGAPGADWAEDYQAVVSSGGEALGNERSPDDLLFIYTGGTTGMPRGVMWRQEDVWNALGGGGELLTGANKPETLDEHLDNVKAGLRRQRLLPACPLMHGTGLLTAINALGNGGTVVTVGSRKLDAHALWSAVERDGVNVMAIVGDVFARPLAAALGEKSYDLSSLAAMISSGVIWSSENKQALLAHHPAMALIDSLGASEAIGLGASVSGAGVDAKTAEFQLSERVKVFTDDWREAVPGSGQRGRVARTGAIPLGYYKDAEKTAATFPVVDGVRYSMPGDYAIVEADGKLCLLGRSSQCINTGGEKVFPEEVEEVLKRHALVEDAAVVGVPDEKWGQSITALVTASSADPPTEEDLREHVRGALSGYKIPKRVFCVDSLGRSPSGKMDYKGVTARAMDLCGIS